MVLFYSDTRCERIIKHHAQNSQKQLSVINVLGSGCVCVGGVDNKEEMKEGEEMRVGRGRRGKFRDLIYTLMLGGKM